MEHKSYSVQNYIKACQEFADDTAEWGELDDYHYYETTSCGNWGESCDGSYGGIDVS